MIYEVLPLKKWGDLVEMKFGCLAKKRPDIAPFAYELIISRPLNREMIDKLIVYGNGANPTSIEQLYSLCNGLKVGATKFSVYGIKGVEINGETADVRLEPFDLDLPNIFARPASYPENILIVGSSTEWDQDGNSSKYFHVIEQSSQILVCKEDDYLAVNRSYSNIETWLVKEVEKALKVKTRF